MLDPTGVGIADLTLHRPTTVWVRLDRTARNGFRVERPGGDELMLAVGSGLTLAARLADGLAVAGVRGTATDYRLDGVVALSLSEVPAGTGPGGDARERSDADPDDVEFSDETVIRVPAAPATHESELSGDSFADGFDDADRTILRSHVGAVIADASAEDADATVVRAGSHAVAPATPTAEDAQDAEDAEDADATVMRADRDAPSDGLDVDPDLTTLRTPVESRGRTERESEAHASIPDPDATVLHAPVTAAPALSRRPRRDDVSTPLAEPRSAAAPMLASAPARDAVTQHSATTSAATASAGSASRWLDTAATTEWTLLLHADGTDARYPLTATAILGRAPELPHGADRNNTDLIAVRSPGGQISASHVRFRRERGSVVVRDLWTSNGTVVTMGAAAATPGATPPRHRLRSGDEIPLSPGSVVELGDGVTVTVERRGDASGGVR